MVSVVAYESFTDGRQFTPAERVKRGEKGPTPYINRFVSDRRAVPSRVKTFKKGKDSARSVNRGVQVDHRRSTVHPG